MVTADDGEQVPVPTFESGRAAHDHLDVVFVAGDRFTGFSSGAVWDDVKWGTRNFPTTELDAARAWVAG